jgi:hypothetical protein
MRTVGAFLAEIVGLFVDDGSLALGLLLWCAAIGISTSLVPSLRVHPGSYSAPTELTNHQPDRGPA